MARPNNSNLGFTLIELLTVVMITGILASIAWPYLSVKVFARTVPQVESVFKIVSLKARTNSGNPYRVNLQGVAPGPQVIKAYYIVNGSCNSPAAAAWKQDPTQTLEIPDDIGVDGFPPGGFCFDGTGQVTSLPIVPITPPSFTISNRKQNSLATRAVIAVSLIGDVSRTTFDQNNINLNGKL